VHLWHVAVLKDYGIQFMCILSKQVRKFMTWTVYQNIIFPPRVHFAQMLIVFKSWFSRYISLSELIDPTQYTFTFFLDEVTLLKLAFDCTQCTSFFFSWWNAFTKIWNLVLQLDEIPWVYSYTSPTVETGYFLNLKKYNYTSWWWMSTVAWLKQSETK
jgi:hypothetical protein